MSVLSSNRQQAPPAVAAVDQLAIVLLVTLFATMYLAVLGVRPLFIPDEVRYGEIAREMLVTGDWIVPRLNGLLYFEKPPLGHWLNAISLFLFGENPFAVRFASAMAAAAAAFIVARLTNCLTGQRQLALFAVFVFLTLLEVHAVATFSVLDSMFSATLNSGIAVFASGILRADGVRSRSAALAGVLFGLAFLTKGFLGFVLPLLILAPWLLVERQFKLLVAQGTIAACAAFAVILPWAISIHLRQPDFWHYFFWIEHIQRFAGANAQHPEPVYYFLIFAPVAAFPWFGLVPAMIEGLRNPNRRPGNRMALRLLMLWIVVPLLFFSVSRGKLITYMLPCFVPLAILMAVGLAAGEGRSRWLRFGLAFNAAVYASAFAALLAAQYSGIGEPLYATGEIYRLALLVAALSLAILITIAGILTTSEQQQRIVAGISIIPVLIALVFSLPERVMLGKAPEAFLRKAAVSLPASALAATDGSFVRAVSWSLARNDVYIIGNGGETQYGLDTADGRGRQLTAEMFGNLVHLAEKDGREIFLACRLTCPQQFVDALPPTAAYSTYGNFHAWRYRMEKR